MRLDVHGKPQGQDESITAYAKLKKMEVALGYFSAKFQDQTIKQLLKDAFVKGLKPAFREQLMRKTLARVEEAIQAAKAEEILQNEFQQEEEIQRTVNAVMSARPSIPQASFPPRPAWRRSGNFYNNINNFRKQRNVRFRENFQRKQRPFTRQRSPTPFPQPLRGNFNNQTGRRDNPPRNRRRFPRPTINWASIISVMTILALALGTQAQMNVTPMRSCLPEHSNP